MIANQIPTSQLTLQQTESVTNLDNGPAEKGKRQRKFSLIHQRVTQQSSQILEIQKELMRQETLSKTKVHRRDTKETDLTVSQLSAPIQQPVKESKMEELIKKSEDDPFLRRKLKNVMENDIKSLKRMNSKNSVTESKPNNNKKEWLFLSKKQDQVNLTQIIDDEYKNIPNDISMVLNNSVLLKKNSSVKELGVSKLPPKPRNDRVSAQQNSMIVGETQKSQFTTLRRQSYKTKVTRLEMMREAEEKEKAVTGYVLDKLVSNSNIQSASKLTKIPMFFKK